MTMPDVIPFPEPSRATRLKLARRYRLEASRLGQLARSDLPQLVVLGLVRQALEWIQLAENEECIAAAEPESITNGEIVR
jgi:hypothetical protein